LLDTLPFVVYHTTLVLPVPITAALSCRLPPELTAAETGKIRTLIFECETGWLLLGLGTETGEQEAKNNVTGSIHISDASLTMTVGFRVLFDNSAAFARRV
jgi:hypothetical protein